METHFSKQLILLCLFFIGISCDTESLLSRQGLPLLPLCSDTLQCPPNSECTPNPYCLSSEKRCFCGDGYVPSVNELECFKIPKEIGDSCFVDQDCVSVPNTMCHTVSPKKFHFKTFPFVFK